MMGEILALWCLCKVASIFGVVILKVDGDCRVTIKWVQGEFNMEVVLLLPWCSKIHSKLKKSCHISFHHIYREQNQLVDKISKSSLKCKEGFMLWE